MDIYFIPGLGANRKIFRNIVVPEGYTAHYFDWIPPHKNETLQQYALRLTESIDTSKPFVVVGLSMGGMIAAEIANKYPLAELVILSSVASSQQLPFYFRYAGKVRLHKLIPITLVKYAANLKRLFTSETSEQRAVIRKMIRETDDRFIKWAMHAIVTWKGKAERKPLLHIHGSKDELLPAAFCRPTHIIKGGGHLMVMTRASEINALLDEYLGKVRDQPRT